MPEVTLPPLMSSVPVPDAPMVSARAVVQVPLEIVAVPFEPVPLPTVPDVPETLPPEITRAATSVEPEAIVTAAAAWLIAPPLATASVPVLTVVPPL